MPECSAGDPRLPSPSFGSTRQELSVSRRTRLPHTAWARWPAHRHDWQGGRRNGRFVMLFPAVDQSSSAPRQSDLLRIHPQRTPPWSQFLPSWVVGGPRRPGAGTCRANLRLWSTRPAGLVRAHPGFIDHTVNRRTFRIARVWPGFERPGDAGPYDRFSTCRSLDVVQGTDP